MRRFREYKKSRGMSYFIDILDWLGGYPFEVAKVESISSFFHRQGFELITLKTPAQTKGNNEFVFAKPEKASPA